MKILINIIILVIGFYALIKGADFFVEGASGIADRLKIPQIVIGLTIVAFGTSAPEAAISISAAIQGSTEIAIGNVLGSNTLNILLILGITACIAPLSVEKNTALIEIPFVIAITVMTVLFGLFFKELGFAAGIIFWIVFAGFFAYLIAFSIKKKDDTPPVRSTMSMPILIICTVVGLAAVVIGSQLTVNSASNIARAIGISERVIALTVIAFGTSLPELITSVSAARKGKNDIAVGNIVGSNIFNILFVLGTTALIKTIPYGSNFTLDGIVSAAAAILLFIFVFRSRRLGRASGAVFLICYGAYFAYMLTTSAV